MLFRSRNSEPSQEDVNVARDLSETSPYSSLDMYDRSMMQYSYSGTDAVATIVVPTIDEFGNYTGQEHLEIGELQTISYSIHRENSPIRTIGHVGPRGFIKGGRTIAGSLIFTTFREYTFYRLQTFRKFLANNKNNNFFAPLADMLPPFDIVITFFDEYGGGSKMKIFGVTIVDEGGTVSVDDLITEQTYTYMARGIQPMVRMTASGQNSPRSVEEYARDVQISNNVFGDNVISEYSSMFISASTEQIEE